MSGLAKNYVYKEMSPSQAANETRRLLKIIPRGGQETRDAILGIIVLANIGVVAAINAMSEIIQNGYGCIVDEVLSKAM